MHAKKNKRRLHEFQNEKLEKSISFSFVYFLFKIT